MDWVWFNLDTLLDYEGLHNFITNMMDPKTTYQPIMIRTILENGSTRKETIDEKTKRITLQRMNDIIEKNENIMSADESLAASRQQTFLKVQ